MLIPEKTYLLNKPDDVNLSNLHFISAQEINFSFFHEIDHEEIDAFLGKELGPDEQPDNWKVDN